MKLIPLLFLLYLLIVVIINENNNFETHLKEYVIFCNSLKNPASIAYNICKSCGFGNKILGLISTLAVGILKYRCVKILNWDSLWSYFNFPLSKHINLNSSCTIYNGHHYGIFEILKNKENVNLLRQKYLIKYKTDHLLMSNEFAYKISNYFSLFNKNIKPLFSNKIKLNLSLGIHLRTGAADKKQYKLHYLKYNDILNIVNISNANNNNTVYISSDSNDVKQMFSYNKRNIYIINSECNSGVGFLKNNNKCALESILDYYYLSISRKLILTKCSSFSLISLFRNINNNLYPKSFKYIGNCTLHKNIYS